MTRPTDYGPGVAKDPFPQYEEEGDAVDAFFVDFTPVGSISSTNVQDAIEEVASEAAGAVVASRRLITFVWDGTNWVEESRT